MADRGMAAEAEAQDGDSAEVSSESSGQQRWKLINL